MAQKTDFDFLIRNALVITLNDSESDAPNVPASSTHMKDENGDMSMLDSLAPPVLPPQYLLLILEIGDVLCVYARNVGAKVEFVIGRNGIPESIVKRHPGKFFAVDPSSRYLAIGDSDTAFSVHALRSREELTAQCLRGEQFDPIAPEPKNLRIKGVIHQMEFLFPSPDDPDHIILLVLAAQKGNTAMFVYEWVAGQSLTEIRANNVKGHTLPENCRMPLLLIPLTIKSAFLLISAENITECRDLLEGSPDYYTVDPQKNAATGLHIGICKPLWTAWTRPTRTRNWCKTHDDLYLAREDGFVAFLEIDSDRISERKSVAAFKTQHEAGNLTCNVGTAFTSLEIASPGWGGDDILVVGGDSCDGGVFFVRSNSLPALFTLLTIDSFLPSSRQYWWSQ